MNLDKRTYKALLEFQKDEITGHVIYKKLADIEKKPLNKEILSQMSDDELHHYVVLRNHTKTEIYADQVKIFFFYWLARILGITFVMKLMECNERLDKNLYSTYVGFPEIKKFSVDEERHEQKLISMLNEERLSYMGSVVLGLNDALVEFTGALAGYTLALNDSKLIALIGSITGIAAALSMASSEYLSRKSDNESKDTAIKAAFYTGLAYIITVVILVTPFIIIPNVITALIVMLCAALIVIAFFNYYYAVVRDDNFFKRFTEMATISLGVAFVSFLIGYALKMITGIEA